MNQDSKAHCCEGIVRDRIGKVFIVLGQDLRQCLICEDVFTREEAREHYATRCEPPQQTDLRYR